MHEAEIIRMTLVCTEEYMARSLTLVLGSLVTGVQFKSAVDLNSQVVAGFARYVMAHAADGKMHLVTEFLEWYSAHVNCKDTSVSHTWFEHVGKTKQLAKFPLTRHYLIMAAYDPDHKVPRPRPQSDLCNLFTPNDTAAWKGTERER